jgi:hypothetical protein
MIISASRRTDIPAFYGEWFYNRILEKFVLVKNQMNPISITQIDLSLENVDCIVFWTKDPKKFFEYLPKIDALGYKYYFQFTLTSYDTKMESNVKKKLNIIDTFIKLSDQIGKNKIIWRYDPIIINSQYSINYHTEWFEYLCNKLYNYTEKCVISFIDIKPYNFIKDIMKTKYINELNLNEIDTVAKTIHDISQKYNLKIATCSEYIDLDKYGFIHNKCIDDELIKKLFNINVSKKKDTSQRNECKCIVSRDIGTYNTCKHNCVYCYAKKGHSNSKYYVPNSPLLCGEFLENDKITILKSEKREQESELFDNI